MYRSAQLTIEEDRENPRAIPKPTISFVQEPECNEVVLWISILPLLGDFTMYKVFKNLIVPCISFYKNL
jgi:hypothetical protein